MSIEQLCENLERQRDVVRRLANSTKDRREENWGRGFNKCVSFVLQELKPLRNEGKQNE